MSAVPLAAVLAGGRSRRYGSEKSAARVGGVAMVERVLAAAKAVSPEAVVVSSRPVAGAEGVVRIPDRVPGKGPLGGLHAALLEARRRELDTVLLLACDLPLLSPAVLTELVGRWRGGPALAPGRADGTAQVLCALWSGAVLPEVEVRLGAPDRSLQALFQAVGGRVVSCRELGVEGGRAFLNVNTPEDRERAEEAL